MTNEQNNAPKGPNENGHQIIMDPQEFLNFLGHVTQATVIAAITANSMNSDIEKVDDLLKDGKIDEALREIKVMRKGMALITSTVCKLGHELTLHDQAVCEGCEAKGVKVESVTATHIERFQKDTKGFIDEFFSATPVTKCTDRPNRSKPKKGPDTDPFSSGSRFN